LVFQFVFLRIHFNHILSSIFGFRLHSYGFRGERKPKILC
jgi:hypothetical protein